MPTARLCLLIIVAAFGFAGCGKSERPVFAVSGRVTFNGEPLKTGTVTFVPDAKGPAATGNIASDGTYKLTTFTDGDGAIPGTHKVMVTSLKDNGPNAGFSDLIPAHFASDKSGLTAEVKEQPSNTIDFDLKGKPPSSKPPVVMP